MDRLDALRAFMSVADNASFAEAARKLRVSTTWVSRAVLEIEKDLGVALLHRTTRSVRLTPEGAAYLERCRAAVDALDDAARFARGEDAEPRGLLVVTSPVVMGRRHVRPVVAGLLSAHPLLSVKMMSTDRVVRIAEEGIDVAVRIGALANSAMHAALLARTRRVFVASPSYLAAHGEPKAPTELADHSLVAFDNFTLNGEWRLRGGATVKVFPRLLTDDVEIAIEAALDDLGLAYLLSYQLTDHLRQGRLVRVLQPFEPDPVPVHAVFQASRQRSPNVRAFIAAAKARLQEADL